MIWMLRPVRTQPVARRLLPSLLGIALLASCRSAGTPPAASPSSTAPGPSAMAAPSAAPAAPLANPTAPAASEDNAAIPIEAHNPTWGSRLAPVTLVEFGDLECPFCSRAEETLSGLRTLYGPDVLRIVWKNLPLPFHDNARPAAEAAQGVLSLAGNDAFWKFHDAAFANREKLGADAYLTWAKDAGVLDTGAFAAGLEAHTWAAPVDQDDSDAKKTDVSGTPTFFVNGTLILGAQPLDAFKKVIDEELAKAKAAMASGTAADRVYTEMARENVKNRPAESHEPKEDTNVYKVPIGPSPMRGKPDALVTIIEFSDFQCPFCKRVEPTLQAIRTKYGDQVRLVWKDEPLPFHPAAEPAAEAALEIRTKLGDAAFWAAHDALFEHQSELTHDQKVDPDGIATVLAGLGVSADKLKKAMSAHSHQKSIDADGDLAQDFSANGTPHFFINGRRLVGAQPEEKFDAIIDEEITKAQALLSSGTPASALYETLLKDGKGPAEMEHKDLPRSLPRWDPARGNPKGLVTVHEWADFQCPFCGRVQPTLDRLMAAYGNRIRLVWHDLPLPMHPDAPLAAEAAREALAQRGPTAFWAIHDKLFKNQHALKREDLDGYATDLHLDMKAWDAALDGKMHETDIATDASGADSVGITGTPGFIVAVSGATSGYYVNGAQPYPAFERAVRRALADAGAPSTHP